MSLLFVIPACSDYENARIELVPDPKNSVWGPRAAQLRWVLPSGESFKTIRTGVKKDLVDGGPGYIQTNVTAVVSSNRKYVAIEHFSSRYYGPHKEGDGIGNWWSEYSYLDWSGQVLWKKRDYKANPPYSSIIASNGLRIMLVQVPIEEKFEYEWFPQTPVILDENGNTIRKFQMVMNLYGYVLSKNGRYGCIEYDNGTNMFDTKRMFTFFDIDADGIFKIPSDYETCSISNDGRARLTARNVWVRMHKSSTNRVFKKTHTRVVHMFPR